MVPEERIKLLREALRQVAQFRGQLDPRHFGVDNNFATAVAIAEAALAKDAVGEEEKPGNKK